MRIYALPENVRDGLVAYLASQPWKEVHQGMEALRTLREIEPVPDEAGGEVKDHV